MSEVLNHLFQAFTPDENQLRFVGNAFAIQGRDQRLLITAKHVVKKKRPLVFKAWKSDETFDDLRFTGRGYWNDIAHAVIGGFGGLEIERKLKIYQTLSLVSLIDHSLYESTLAIQYLRGSQIGYSRSSGNRIGIPGSSGSPVLDEQNNVVGVHCGAIDLASVVWGVAYRLR